MGKLLAINISKERGTEKREVPQAELVADYMPSGQEERR